MSSCHRLRAWAAPQDGMGLEMLVVGMMLMSIFALVLNLAATGVLLGMGRRAVDSALKNALKVSYTVGTDGKVTIDQAQLTAELRQLLADDLNLDPGSLAPKQSPSLVQSVRIDSVTVYNPVLTPFTDSLGSHIRMPTVTADVTLSYTSLFNAAGGATGGSRSITYHSVAELWVHAR